MNLGTQILARAGNVIGADTLESRLFGYYLPNAFEEGVVLLICHDHKAVTSSSRDMRDHLIELLCHRRASYQMWAVVRVTHVVTHVVQLEMSGRMDNKFGGGNSVSFPRNADRCCVHKREAFQCASCRLVVIVQVGGPDAKGAAA
jgi:hypothetical protein